MLSKLILIVTAMLKRYNFHTLYAFFYYANSEVHETKPLINDDFLLLRNSTRDYHEKKIIYNTRDDEGRRENPEKTFEIQRRNSVLGKVAEWIFCVFILVCKSTAVSLIFIQNEEESEKKNSIKLDGHVDSY